MSIEPDVHMDVKQFRTMGEWVQGTPFFLRLIFQKYNEMALVALLFF